jgi:hypothetical protein
LAGLFYTLFLGNVATFPVHRSEASVFEWGFASVAFVLTVATLIANARTRILDIGDGGAPDKSGRSKEGEPHGEQ